MSEEMKLKPCPFCGGEAEEQWHPNPCINLDIAEPWYSIWCKSCNATIEIQSSKGKAIKSWNTRPEPRQGVDKFVIAHIIAGTNVNTFGGYTEDDLKKADAILRRFTLPAEVKWPELKEAFGQNTFKDGLCHGYNRAINDCKQALEKARKG